MSFLFPSLGTILPSDVSMRRSSVVGSGKPDWNTINAAGHYSVLASEYDQYKNNPTIREDGVLEMYYCVEQRLQRVSYTSGLVFNRVYGNGAWGAWSSNDTRMTIDCYVK